MDKRTDFCGNRILRNECINTLFEIKTNLEAEEFEDALLGFEPLHLLRQPAAKLVVGENCCRSLNRTSIYHDCWGSTKITAHLDHISHRTAAPGTNGSKSGVNIVGSEAVSSRAFIKN